jgi:hypothetical protein
MGHRLSLHSVPFQGKSRQTITPSGTVREKPTINVASFFTPCGSDPVVMFQFTPTGLRDRFGAVIIHPPFISRLLALREWRDSWVLSRCGEERPLPPTQGLDAPQRLRPL